MKPSEKALLETEAKYVEPVNLGRPNPKPTPAKTERKGARRNEYRPAAGDPIKCRILPRVAIDETSSAQNPVVIYGDGLVVSFGEIKTGRIEIRLDDRAAALLAAELINHLSGPYLTTLYAGEDLQRGLVFKAFRDQFIADVEADLEAFDNASDYVL